MANDTNRLLQAIERNTGVAAKVLGEQRLEKLVSGGGAGGGGSPDNAISKETKRVVAGVAGIKDALNKSKVEIKNLNSVMKEYRSKVNDEKDAITEITEAAKRQSVAINQINANTGNLGAQISSLGALYKGTIDESLNSIDAQKDVTRALDQMTTKFTGYLEQTKEAEKIFEELNATFMDGIKSGKEVNDVIKGVTEEFERNKDALGILGINVESISDTFKDTGGDINDFSTALGTMQSELDDNIKHTVSTMDTLSRETLQQQRKVMAANRETADALSEGVGQATSELIKGINDELSKAFIALTAGGIRGDSVLTARASSSLDIGSFNEFIQSEFDSIFSGTSNEQMSRFVASNRDNLTGIIGGAIKTTDDASGLVADWGNEFRDRFAVTGQEQMDMLGQSLKVLVNSGIKPTEENFKTFVKGLDEMSTVSDMSASEILSNLSALSDDTGFKGLLSSMGGGANAMSFLTEAALDLHSAVGLNAEEFMGHTKFLADQRNRGAVERIQQGEFAASLAREIGMSEADTDLVRRGTSFQESLSVDDNKAFIQISALLRTGLADSKNAAAKAGGRDGGSALARLNVLEQGAGITEIQVSQRKSAEVFDANAAAVPLEKQFAKTGEDIVKTLSPISEAIKGLSQSIIGQAAGGAVAMGGGMLQTAIVATVAAAVATGTSPLTALLNGVKSVPGMALKGLSFAAKATGVLGLAYGAVSGVAAAINTEGDIVEKTLTGLVEGVNAMTGGMTGALGGMIYEMLSGEAATEFYSDVINGFTDFFNGIWDFITDGISSALDFGSMVGDFYSGVFSDAGDSVSSTADSLISGVTGFFSSSSEMSAAVPSPSDVINNLQQALSGSGDDMADSANKNATEQATKDSDARVVENNKLIAAIDNQTEVAKDQKAALDEIKNKKTANAPLLSASVPNAVGASPQMGV